MPTICYKSQCTCDLATYWRPRHSRRMNTEVGSDRRAIGRGETRDRLDGLVCGQPPLRYHRLRTLACIPYLFTSDINIPSNRNSGHE